MSYPYTKPTPRYGFRRSWNDPNTGLVGSGPGRPLRTYITDAEVGLPQKVSGFGDSAETPISSGIFNIGPASIFSRGVFTPDPPWATPRYIASQPDGFNGLGGCLSCGGLGAFGAIPTCDANALISWIVDRLGKVPPFSSLPNLEVCVLGKCTGINVKKEALNAVTKGLTALGDAKLNDIIAYAEKGASALKGYMATNIIPTLVKNIKAALPSGIASYIPVTDVMLINLFNKFADEMVSWAQNCKSGIDQSNLLTMSASIGQYPMCRDPSSDPDGDGWGWENGKSCKVSSFPFCKSASDPDGDGWGWENGKSCVVPSTISADDAAVQALTYAQDVSIKPFDMTRASKIDVSQLSTIAAEQANCAAAGGEWYPGGAECDVPAGGGAIYNCRAPVTTTEKRYYCVPAGTSGAVSIDTGSSDSNLPLILGAAAIVALFLFMR